MDNETRRKLEYLVSKWRNKAQIASVNAIGSWLPWTYSRYDAKADAMFRCARELESVLVEDAVGIDHDSSK